MEKANYKIQLIEEHFNNPLLEALPLPLLSKKERGNLFIERNMITKAEKELPADLRIYKLSNISKIFVPTNWGIELSQTLDLLIREGYRRRNPLTHHHLRLGYQIVVNSFNDLPDLKDPVGSTSVIGCSGMGKTTTIEKILSYYPQVIEHEEYCTIPLHIYQIVYLHVNVPNDGSVKAFCLELLNEIDKILKTSYVEKNKRSSTAALANLIAKLCTMYHVGLVCLDESQNLLNSNYGREKLSEFLNNLSNKIGCPFCIIGTPKTQELFNGTFHLCRRLESKGSTLLQPYSKDSRDWKSFIKILWQDGLFLNGKNELTAEIYDALHYYSTGIPAMAKNIISKIQHIILNNPDLEEEITPELIREVAQEYFPNVERNIKAINSNDLGRIDEMGDWTVNTGFKKPKKKTRIRRDGNQNHEITDTVFFLLINIGYSEYFTKSELKEQARLIAEKIEPGTSKINYIPLIIDYMKELIKQKESQEVEKLEQSDLEEDIISVDQLF